MKKKDKNTGLYIGLGAILLFMMSGKKNSSGALNSEFYTIDDVKKSQTAIEQGITEQFEPLPLLILKNASFYAQKFLDPLSRLLGSKLSIDSWYRVPRLNNEVGGVPGSYHLKALGADFDLIESGALNNKKAIKQIILSDLPFYKLIIYGSIDKPTGLHVSLNPEQMENRELLLKKPDGSYKKLSRSELLMKYKNVEI